MGEPGEGGGGGGGGVGGGGQADIYAPLKFQATIITH